MTAASEYNFTRDDVTTYRPSSIEPGITIAKLADGSTQRVTTPFAEFHRWMIHPTKAPEKK